MTTDIGLDGSIRCKDENGIIWSWITKDGGITVKDTQINCDHCLDAAALYPRIMGLGDHTVVYDEFICDKVLKMKEGNDNMMNDVLNLYRKIKRDEITEELKNKVEEEYNNLEPVKKYNDLINTFKASLDELVHEYPHVEGERPTFFRTGYSNDYTYEINSDLKADIRKNYQEEYNNRLAELDKLVTEVDAMLSLDRGDKDYQIEVLDRYGITKKGKLNV